MGSPLGEAKRRYSETPHTVTLSRGFYLGKHEVTQSQWEKVMGSNPSRYKGGNRPVESVSWTEVTAFCDKLTELERKAGRLLAGMSYQLPTEAQWEYACRADTKTAFSFGAELTSEQANISGGSGETVDLGKYPGNSWGFHDMHGNVFEWCADWYGAYPTGAVGDPVDPVGPADGSGRVIRGGSWDRTAPVPRIGSGTGPPPATSTWASASVSDRPASSGVSRREPPSRAEPARGATEAERSAAENSRSTVGDLSSNSVPLLAALPIY